MNINKTADECIVENASVLLKCFGDQNFSVEQKQKFTNWIISFFEYQDAINQNNQKKINIFKDKLNSVSVPSYYKNALQEFNNANLFFNNSPFKKLNKLIFDYSTKPTIKIVNNFSKVFINSIKNFNIQYEKNFIENFKTMIFTINYHLSYQFKKELEKTVSSFINIIKTTIFCKKRKKEFLLIEWILENNEKFFWKIQQIQLTNFIYKLEEFFKNIFDFEEINEKIKNLIFSEPKKLTTSMYTLLKNNKINFYNEIWENDKINEKKAKMLMHLFAYETYFVQGQNHQQTYEDLILKNIIDYEKYWIIFHNHKNLN